MNLLGVCRDGDACERSHRVCAHTNRLTMLGCGEVWCFHAVFIGERAEEGRKEGWRGWKGGGTQAQRISVAVRAIFHVLSCPFAYGSLRFRSPGREAHKGENRIAT